MSDTYSCTCCLSLTFYQQLYFQSLHRISRSVADAYETSKMLCEQYYLTSPDMEITKVNCMVP